MAGKQSPLDSLASHAHSARIALPVALLLALFLALAFVTPQSLRANQTAADPAPTGPLAPPTPPSETTAPKPVVSNSTLPQKASPPRIPAGPEFENVRKALNALNPEQLKRFQQNFHRWSNLSPEEKKLLRDRESFQRQKMAEETQAALASTGLTLDEDAKIRFFKRYSEERRKIEESLRSEIEKLRKPQVEAALSRLKVEFTNSGENAATALPKP
jgi:hypothetical protein